MFSFKDFPSSFKDFPSTSTLFSWYAATTASVMMIRTMFNDLLPEVVRTYLCSFFLNLFKRRSNELTLVIEESTSFSQNQIYEASEAYLSTKITSKTKRVKIYKTPYQKNITVRLEKNEEIVDTFEGVELTWRHVCFDPAHRLSNPARLMQYPVRPEKKAFELTFHQKNKDMVFNSYIPFVLQKATAIAEEERSLSMYTLSKMEVDKSIKWASINLEHPATFDTIAMEPKLKRSLIEDLNRFLRRKHFYKRVGRAWKRGYLLYGPPGTGKSSLVAAMANYLKFDVYDLQLASIMDDSDLRKLLLQTGNRSILVIEDIDCSADLTDRRNGATPLEASSPDDEEDEDQPDTVGRKRSTLTLSGLLNFIDGLWSSCGDERIIVFTTNHKERLDPALLRPGRMDMHIHMSYCTPSGFRLLASNYLGISGEHNLFGEIDGLLRINQVTPAQVAEALMKSEDADVALRGFVKKLKRKNFNGDVEGDIEEASEVETMETEMQHTENRGQKARRKKKGKDKKKIKAAS